MGKDTSKIKVGGRRFGGQKVTVKGGTVVSAGRKITTKDGTEITSEGGTVVYGDKDLDVTYE